MSNTAIHRARSSALPGQPGPLGQAVQPHLSARGRPCEQPPGGPHVLGPAGEVPVDGEGGRLEGRQVGVWRAVPSATAKASWGEESRQLTANMDVEASRPGRGRLGLRWGGGEAGRVLDLPRPGVAGGALSWPWAGAGQDGEAQLPAHPPCGHPNTQCPPLPSPLAGGHWPGGSREGPG